MRDPEDLENDIEDLESEVRALTARVEKLEKATGQDAATSAYPTWEDPL